MNFKLSRLDLLQSDTSPYTLERSVIIPAEMLASHDRVIALEELVVSLKGHYDDVLDRVYLDVSIQGLMVVPCAISLEPITIPLATKSSETFSFSATDDEDVQVVNDDEIDLLPIILQLILIEVPWKVVKENVVYPKGEGWEVITEADLEAMKKESLDPRWAKLREFKLEDE